MIAFRGLVSPLTNHEGGEKMITAVEEKFIEEAVALIKERGEKEKNFCGVVMDAVVDVLKKRLPHARIRGYVYSSPEEADFWIFGSYEDDEITLYRKRVSRRVFCSEEGIRNFVRNVLESALEADFRKTLS